MAKSCGPAFADRAAAEDDEEGSASPFDPVREVGTSATEPRPSIRRDRAPTLNVVRAAGCASAHRPASPFCLSESVMLTLQGFVVVLSGYVGFAARREGASFQRALLAGALSAAMLQSIVTGGTVWLQGVAWARSIELAMTIWALACVASAGASTAGLFATGAWRRVHRRRPGFAE